MYMVFITYQGIILYIFSIVFIFFRQYTYEYLSRKCIPQNKITIS